MDLDVLLEHDLSEQDLGSIIDFVARASWWVSPSVYQSIQVVNPKARRNRGKEERGQIIDGVRLWYNEPAQKAFWLALDKNKEKIKKSYVCHIYDGSVWDPAHFTNLANMTAFPKCLQSLSEWKPITEVLKYHSYKIYGYTGPENKIPTIPKYYPELWLHVSNPNQNEVQKIIGKSKEQSTKRPSNNAKDNI